MFIKYLCPVPVPGNLLNLETKEAITATMMQVYNDVMADAKPKLEGLIKQEAKRRRKDFVCPTCKVYDVDKFLKAFFSDISRRCGYR